MGILSQIDAEMQKDLLEFVEEQEKNKSKTFGEYLHVELLKDLINGKCKITGTVTNHKTGKLYVEYSFRDEEE